MYGIRNGGIDVKYDGCVVGMTLRNLRKDKKITLEGMCSETGISVSTIKQYEQGGRKISIRNLFVLIDYFGVDANTILNVSESENDNSIDERLRCLNKSQKEYLKQSFMFMLNHVEEMVS